MPENPDPRKAIDILFQDSVPEMSVRREISRVIDGFIRNERERCANIAEAIDSGRGNEKEIAHAIRQPLVDQPLIGDTK